jgi:putative membrane protein
VIRRALFTWAANVAAIFVASVFISGVDYAHKFWVLVVAGLVFGLVNMLVKPVVTLLALPVVFLTFGIALFFINLLMLYVTSWIVGPFHIDHFSDAVWATIIIWAVNMVLDRVFAIRDRGSSRRRRRAAY